MVSQLQVFDRLTEHTLRQRIANKIREAILRGSLGEGERLVERKLASQFATGLTAVREALIELEAEGFVTKKPNSATYVTKLTLADVEKIYAVRRVLEVLAVEEAASRANVAQLEALEKLNSELLDAARLKDTQLYMQKDFALHEAIWAISDNEYLQTALRRIFLPLSAFTVIRIASRDPFDLLDDAQKHIPLLRAIKSHDPQAAKTALLTSLDEWSAVTGTTILQETR